MKRPCLHSGKSAPVSRRFHSWYPHPFLATLSYIEDCGTDYLFHGSTWGTSESRQCLSKTQSIPWVVAHYKSLTSFSLTCEAMQKYHNKFPVSVEFYFFRNRQLISLEFHVFTSSCQILQQSLTCRPGVEGDKRVMYRYCRSDLAYHHKWPFFRPQKLRQHRWKPVPTFWSKIQKH